VNKSDSRYIVEYAVSTAIIAGMILAMAKDPLLGAGFAFLVMSYIVGALVFDLRNIRPDDDAVSASGHLVVTAMFAIVIGFASLAMHGSGIF
jgi:hypothetical protein